MIGGVRKLPVERADVRGKRVLLRAGFNVPCKDGKITDTYRLVTGAPTITRLFERGARCVVILSHIGRPAGERREDLSLRVCVPVLESLLKKPIQFIDDCISDEAFEATANAAEGSVIMLESVRFHLEEEAKKGFNGKRADDAAIERFSKALARHGDIYVNDAFDLAHRAFCSLTMLPIQPRYSGPVMQDELSALSRILGKPKRPYLVIFGGAKGAEKTLIVESVLDHCDEMIVGGGMAFTFLKVRDNMEIGASMYDEANVETVKQIFAKAKAKNVQIHLPSDFIVAESPTADAKTSTATVESGIQSPLRGLDIGEQTQRQFATVIQRAATIAWNGPQGVFECPPFESGTRAVLNAVREAKATCGVDSVAGGGDTTAALAHFNALDAVSHVCTGGGAMLQTLGGRPLAAVDALTDDNSEQ